MKNYKLTTAERTQILKKMKATRTTQTEIALHINQTKASINNKLAGRRGCSIQEVNAIITYLESRLAECSSIKKNILKIKNAKAKTTNNNRRITSAK